MADPKLKLGNDIWATKQKSLLAYNDEGGNYKSIPFQVDRISGGTYVGRNGLIQSAASNEPRIDFTSNTKGALLLEPQRTNLDTNNSFIDIAAWSLVDMSRTNGFGVAPDGTNNSTQLSLNSVTGNSRISRAYAATLSSGSAYTFSAYYKGIAGEKAYMRCLGQGGSGTDVNKLITFTGSWQRETLSFVAGSSQNYTYFVDTRVGSDDDATEFEVWGGQLEAGTHATSIIPTSSSAVTRVVDFTFIPSGLQNILNTSEGTLFFEVDVPRVSSTASFERIVLSDQNASTDRIIFDNYGGNWRALMLSSAGNVNKTIVNVTANQRIKVAIAYSSTELRISYDGNAVTTTSGSYTPSTTLESFKFSNKDGGSKWNGNIYNARYFDSALSNAELVEITTP